MVGLMPDTGASMGELPTARPTTRASVVTTAPPRAEEPEEPPEITLTRPPRPPEPLADTTTGKPRAFMTDPLKRGRAALGDYDETYRPDIRGVQRMFLEYQDEIDQCMTDSGPLADPDERRVMVQVQLATEDGEDGPIGKLDQITAPRDSEGRYDNFLKCAMNELADLEFGAPQNGTSTVNWSVRR